MNDPERRLSAAMLVGFTGLAAVVPGPLTVLRTLTGTHPGPVGPQSLDVVALTVAGAIVWGLIGWTVLIAVVALLARAPGAVGRGGRRLLRRVAPGFVRRAVIAGMGVSVLAGAAACSSDGGNTGPHSERPAVVMVTADRGIGTAADVALGTAVGTAVGLADVGSSDVDMADVGRAPNNEWPGTAIRGVPSPAAAPPHAAAPPAAAVAGAAADRAVGEVDLDWPVERPNGTAPRVDVDWPDPDPDPDPHPDAPLPTRTAPQSSAQQAGSDAHTSIVVVVQPGDTLWHIAATQLGADASDTQIDATWRNWFAVNRDVIGSDPDHIEPGQRLHAPGTVRSTAAGGAATQHPTAELPAADHPTADHPATDNPATDNPTGHKPAGADTEEH